MNWKGKELKNVRDLLDYGVRACATAKEAQDFMLDYRAYSPFADENIGYITGYLDGAEACRIQEWFGVVHPVFGKL